MKVHNQFKSLNVQLSLVLGSHSQSIQKSKCPTLFCPRFTISCFVLGSQSVCNQLLTTRLGSGRLSECDIISVDHKFRIFSLNKCFFKLPDFVLQTIFFQLHFLLKLLHRTAQVVHVSHNVTAFEFFYEPFYVSLDSAPLYDERFEGYGFTRNTQVHSNKDRERKMIISTNSRSFSSRDMKRKYDLEYDNSFHCPIRKNWRSKERIIWWVFSGLRAPPGWVAVPGIPLVSLQF